MNAQPISLEEAERNMERENFKLPSKKLLSACYGGADDENERRRKKKNTAASWCFRNKRSYFELKDESEYQQFGNENLSNQYK